MVTIFEAINNPGLPKIWPISKDHLQDGHARNTVSSTPLFFSIYHKQGV